MLIKLHKHLLISTNEAVITQMYKSTSMTCINTPNGLTNTDIQGINMTGHKYKARTLLCQHQSLLKQQQQFHQVLNTKLTALDDQLYQPIQSQQFLTGLVGIVLLGMRFRILVNWFIKSSNAMQQRLSRCIIITLVRQEAHT